MAAVGVVRLLLQTKTIVFLRLFTLAEVVVTLAEVVKQRRIVRPESESSLEIGAGAVEFALLEILDAEVVVLADTLGERRRTGRDQQRQHGDQADPPHAPPPRRMYIALLPPGEGQGSGGDRNALDSRVYPSIVRLF